MTDASKDEDEVLPWSDITAGQLLTRVAGLLGRTRAMADFTPDGVQQALGVPVELDQNGEYGTGGRLTDEWFYSLNVNPDSLGEPLFDLEFLPVDPSAHPDMTGICEVDLDHFAGLLESTGFVRERWWGEHGRRMGCYFNRDALRVRVGTQGEADSPPDKRTHECVRTIQVR